MVRDFLAKAEIRLKEAGIEDYSFEAAVIFEEVYGRSFSKDLLLKRLEREPSQEETDKICDCVLRRTSGEPLQYVIGKWEFYGMEFSLGKGVLIPRQDTEILIDAALSLLKSSPSPKILDLCSGTGCIPIVLKKKLPQAAVMALELYDDAYSYLIKNINSYGGSVKPFKLDALDKESAKGFHELDLITCNPPYLTAKDMAYLQKEVSFEPAAALYGSPDGLEYYRIIPSIWMDSIRDGGHILFEIGCSQAESVSGILKEHGFEDIEVIKDLSGRDRAVLAKKPPNRQ